MMHRKILKAFVVASTLALVACGNGDANVKEKLGLKTSPPDEFSVVTRAPLAVPPDYTLRPPRPGADRPNELSVRDEARKTVFGVNDTDTTIKATGDTASSDFMNKLGANQADPDIRTSLNPQVKALDKKQEPVVDKLLFWKDKDAPGKTIDPVEEQKRLQATGQSTTSTQIDTTTTVKSTDDTSEDNGEPGPTTIKKRNEDILQTP